MDIRRDFYLEKLIKRKSNGLIKVITGIRRCGKSYLLNNIFYHHLLDSGVEADHIIRFAFDSADDLSDRKGKAGCGSGEIYGIYSVENYRRGNILSAVG